MAEPEPFDVMKEEEALLAAAAWQSAEEEERRRTEEEGGVGVVSEVNNNTTKLLELQCGIWRRLDEVFLSNIHNTLGSIDKDRFEPINNECIRWINNTFPDNFKTSSVDPRYSSDKDLEKQVSKTIIGGIGCDIQDGIPQCGKDKDKVEEEAEEAAVEIIEKCNQPQNEDHCQEVMKVLGVLIRKLELEESEININRITADVNKVLKKNSSKRKPVDYSEELLEQRKSLLETIYIISILLYNKHMEGDTYKKIIIISFLKSQEIQKIFGIKQEDNEQVMDTCQKIYDTYSEYYDNTRPEPYNLWYIVYNIFDKIHKKNGKKDIYEYNDYINEKITEIMTI